MALCRFVFLLLVIISCVALPRPKHDSIAAPVLPKSSMTGMVISSPDRTSSSAAVYYYDFRQGEITLLSGGESGDLLPLWISDRLYLFNRDNHRTSYSTFLPRSGAGSRSLEVKTPLAEAFEPYDVIQGMDELVMSMNTLGKVAIVAGKDLKQELPRVDVGDGLFRPSSLMRHNDSFLVLHQSLSDKYLATGVGKVFIADRQGGIWAWRDMNVSRDGIQGVQLNVSNPVGFLHVNENSALVAGICFDSMGEKCAAGIDRIDFDDWNVTRVSKFESHEWSFNGGMMDGPADDAVFACMKRRDSDKKYLARYTVATGAVSPVYEYEGPGCTGVFYDSNSQQTFIGDVDGNGHGKIVRLDRDGQRLSETKLGFRVGGFVPTYD